MSNPKINCFHSVVVFVLEKNNMFLNFEIIKEAWSKLLCLGPLVGDVSPSVGEFLGPPMVRVGQMNIDRPG